MFIAWRQLTNVMVTHTDHFTSLLWNLTMSNMLINYRSSSPGSLFDRILKKKMAMTIEWIPPRPTSYLNTTFGIVCSRK